MPDSLLSVLILGGVGLAFAIMIAVAHSRLRVWEDPRIDVVAGMLPGVNCGACGLPGCRGFAEKAVAGEIQPSKCNVLTDDGIGAIAGYLGVEAGDADRRIARLLCAGGSMSVYAVRNTAVFRHARQRQQWPEGARAARGVVSAWETVPLPVSSTRFT